MCDKDPPGEGQTLPLPPRKQPQLEVWEDEGGAPKDQVSPGHSHKTPGRLRSTRRPPLRAPARPGC
jgi:hypothetical protein